MAWEEAEWWQTHPIGVAWWEDQEDMMPKYIVRSLKTGETLYESDNEQATLGFAYGWNHSATQAHDLDYAEVLGAELQASEAEVKA